MKQLQMLYQDVRSLPGALATLEDLPPTESGILSVVLDTSVSRVPGQAYLLFFRNAAREVRAELETRASVDIKSYDAAVEQVDYFLLHQFAPRNPGLALYVASDPELFLAVPLPTRPTQQVVWDNRPLVAPLIEVLDDYERVAVALTDKREARIFTVYLGAIDLEHTIESDLVGRHAPGDYPHRTRSPRVREGRYTPGMGATVAWSGMAQSSQERRHQQQAMAHARLVAGALMDLLRERPFDRLFIAGPEEAVNMVRDVLPRPLEARFAGTVSMQVGASEAEVLDEMLRIAEEREREGEVAIVRRLLDGAGVGTATLGLEPTLEAASDGRVDKLVVGDDLPGHVRVCTQCGRLTSETEQCPRCGNTLTEASDPRERLVTEVLDHGGRVEFISGEAEQLLLENGGVGAFTRY